MKKIIFTTLILLFNYMFVYGAVELKPLSEIKFKKGDESHFSYYAQRCSALISIVSAHYMEFTEKLYGKDTANQIQKIGNNYLELAIKIRMKNNNLNFKEATNMVMDEQKIIGESYVNAIKENFYKSGQQFIGSFVFDDYDLCFNAEKLNIY